MSARARAMLWHAGAAAVLCSCAPTALPSSGSKACLRDVVTLFALPAFDDLVLRAETLEQKVAALDEAPSSDTLEAAQVAWGECHSAWKLTEVLDFGPVRERSLDALVDQWPPSVAKIEALVSGDAVIDAALVERTGANARGLPALEHLLFDDAIVTGADGPRRRALAAALATDLSESAQQIRDLWSAEDGLGAEMLDAGTGSDRYATAKKAIDVLVNQLVFTTELALDDKLGRPAGKKTGGVPKPELVEAGPSGRSLLAVVANLEGIEAVYLGGLPARDGVGVSELVARRSPGLDLRVRAALDEARARVDAIPEPLAEAVIDDPESVEAAYQSLRAVRQIIATDVVAVLGAVLTFNDNDGD